MFSQALQWLLEAHPPHHSHHTTPTSPHPPHHSHLTTLPQLHTMQSARRGTAALLCSNPCNACVRIVPKVSCSFFMECGFIYIYIWDSFRQNGPSYIYIKCYKNASLLNRYIFRTVNAINFLFSTLHTTPFLYGKILLGVLHLLRASIATSDTPVGSNLP